MGIWGYRVLWWIAAPVLFIGSILHPSTRFRWRERWGWSLPGVEPGALWVHAASLGEGRAAEALFEALRPMRRVVFLRTASSRAGLENARGQEVIAALPLDAPWVVRRWLDRVRPRALVLIESEIWPNLILGCKKRGIPVLLLSARRGRGQRRFQRVFPGLYRECLSGLQWCSTPSEEDAQVFRGFGVKTIVASDLKLDAPLGEPPVEFLRRWWVGASTHAPEESRLLAAQRRSLEAHATTLVLAPRRLDRVAEVERAAVEEGLHVVRLSSVQGVVDADVLLVDSFGVLRHFFRGALSAYVGGTGTARVPAHSPAEAASAGIALLAGSHRDAHASIWSNCVFREAIGDLDEALEWSFSRGPVPPLRGGLSSVLPEVLRACSGPVPGEGPERLVLMPVSWVWRLASGLRNLSWRLRRPQRVGLPVISVGSLGSGGTGKTVVSVLLAREMEALGEQVAVVARGYRRGPGPPVRGSEGGDNAAYLGDELAMMARRGIHVVSSPDRIAAANAAKAKGATVVVLDDAFQHRSIGRDLDVVVIDGEWPRSGGPMPVGSEREGLGALSRADVIWLHGAGLSRRLTEALPAHALQVRGQFHPVCWVSGERTLALHELHAVRVCAFAGIGRPGRFLAMLVELGVDVIHWHAFPDHHAFSQKELAALRNWAEEHPIVCTEKDAVRLPDSFPVIALRVEMRIEEGEAELRETLRKVVSQ